MLLVAFAYRELNNRMPDSGTTFTWVTKAFGPWAGWMAGWGLIAATICVLSNLAAVAVDFFFILLADVFRRPELADLTTNLWINIPMTILFLVLASGIAYRGMDATQNLQTILVIIQLVALGMFAGFALYQAYLGLTEAPEGVSVLTGTPEAGALALAELLRGGSLAQAAALDRALTLLPGSAGDLVPLGRAGSQAEDPLAGDRDAWARAAASRACARTPASSGRRTPSVMDCW